ncbi:hypothetical protein GUITHDRAFT_107353 [Guillardia theta CCMP2712]|uniref:Serine aminopeptidase S33 domain-containing protein n=1 Tax=Guillardia theta (strain CCMP2712) TaxID=905079 RepID=L1JEP2_GUITC|nr:hypothetical protein GUITHDRAFT_107353 [Guillardia theta CCMP2712]EKX47008.1 hypothetical protein GUITHDRAFT_107353 [Guillardia theta CCMP2712]|eukprot:XP_005833988.1 hypothetical protein GUITHDRAFT_107353 [Guillardia theta CCMP2712]
MLIPGESLASTSEKKEHASCLAIYCHANGEDVGILHEAGKWISDHLGVHFIIPEYPGYGMAPGQPNELSVNRNIRAAYEFAVHGLQWDPSHIIFVGRSIGTGPAVRMAAEVRCGGLILISPYTSVRDMVRRHAGSLTSWLTADLINIFPSEETIPFVRCPLLLVHGSNDKVSLPCILSIGSASQADHSLGARDETLHSCASGGEEAGEEVVEGSGCREGNGSDHEDEDEEVEEVEVDDEDKEVQDEDDD